MHTTTVSFPPFRLDLEQERLWRDDKEVVVRRKPFAILKYLVANPKRLVTHEELLEHVWQGVAVSESTIRTQLHELRQLLGEGVIETVIGRGYRFISELAAAAPEPRAPVVDERIVVGRTTELATLAAALDRAHAGHRQVCFVTGEPGIGKTTLVDTFVASLQGGVVAVRGQCIEQHGTPEPYLAVIEIFSRLRQSERGRDTLAALVRHAPMFLAQVPQLAPPEQHDDIVKRAHGGSEAKLVRELIDALEAICINETLVLVLEDLQWSDVATIDLLALLAARRERARLLVVATSRRGEANTVTHPLNRVMRTLIARGGAAAIPLERVAADDIRELVDLRFPAHQFPAALIDVVDLITAGTPLFVVSVIDDLVGRGMLAVRDDTWVLTSTLDDVRAHRPETVRQLIDIRLDRLEPGEQRVLEAASAVGIEFSCGLVAAALEMSIEQVDEVCDSLVRRSLFLRHEGEEVGPDGSSTPRYAMTHGLVQEVCVARGAPARRQRWHRLVAQHLARVYGARSAEIATVLAKHCELGQLPLEAVGYYATAGERTAQRFASNDALALFQRGLELMRRVPETPERDAFELRLLAGVVASTLRTSDPSSPEPAQHLQRMSVLARRLDDGPRLCSALLNLMFRHQLIADHAAGIAICEQLDDVIRSASLHPALVGFARAMMALNRMWRGEREGVAQVFASIIDAGDTLEDPSLGILGPTDRRTVLTTYLALVRWLTGEREQALRDSERAIAMANDTNDPFGIGFARCNTAWLRSLSGAAPELILALAESVLAIPGATVWHATAATLVGWARPTDASVDLVVQDFRAHFGNCPLGTTRLGLTVTDMLRRAGRTDEARTLADEMLAFARARSELVVEPLLQKLRDSLT